MRAFVRIIGTITTTPGMARRYLFQ